MEHEGGLDIHIRPGMTLRCQHWGLRGLGGDNVDPGKLYYPLETHLLDIIIIDICLYYLEDKSLSATLSKIPKCRI